MKIIYSSQVIEQFPPIFFYNAVQKPVFDDNLVFVDCLQRLMGNVLPSKLDAVEIICFVPSGFYSGI